jgi:hypothetical protein
MQNIDQEINTGQVSRGELPTRVAGKGVMAGKMDTTLYHLGYFECKWGVGVAYSVLSVI